jgi:prepilin-type N-terminal cleavage/methylation domain-containing protein
MPKSRQSGFTLIEIAIVLVIIGLLLGGVLKGQELITSARVRNLIAQQDGIKAAFFGFQDRFRAYPGDYASAHLTLKCPTGSSAGSCLNGNGNGIIRVETGTTVTIGGVASEVHEEILAWMHLASAGFLNGSYTMTAGDADPNDRNNPNNPYNIFLQIMYDSVYADTTSPPPNKHNLKTGAQVPVEIISEVDRKIDDGNGLRGGFRYSQYKGNAPAAPPAPAAAYATGQCVDTSGVWFIPQGEVNCGGASLF